MKDNKKSLKQQEQKDQHPKQQKHQQQKTQQTRTPKNAPKQEVFHEHERIETRMTR